MLARFSTLLLYLLSWSLSGLLDSQDSNFSFSQYNCQHSQLKNDCGQGVVPMLIISALRCRTEFEVALPFNVRLSQQQWETTTKAKLQKEGSRPFYKPSESCRGWPGCTLWSHCSAGFSGAALAWSPLLGCFQKADTWCNCCQQSWEKCALKRPFR